ncbi:MAG: sulfurtransferase [Bacteroidetes bacterium]|nr:MAG: sulfurtransferase [Bacteroidota bacterium]
MNIQELINNATTTIVDVRTPSEFMGGSVPGSVNIPLNEVVSRIDELRLMQPMVLCCASGGRSGQAVDYLSSQGLDVVNGGGWKSVNAQKV